MLGSQEAVRMYIPSHLYYLSGSKPRMHSFEGVWWNSRCRFKHCAMQSAIRSPANRWPSLFEPWMILFDCRLGTASFQPLRLRRQLVCQFWPLAFDHGSHLVRDVVDVLDIEHVFVKGL